MCYFYLNPYKAQLFLHSGREGKQKNKINAWFWLYSLYYSHRYLSSPREEISREKMNEQQVFKKDSDLEWESILHYSRQKHADQASFGLKANALFSGLTSTVVSSVPPMPVRCVDKVNQMRSFILLKLEEWKKQLTIFERKIHCPLR